jgi:hypothetical protein
MKERTVILEADGAPQFGMLRSRSWFPLPDLGTVCVCCDAPADERLEFDPSGRDQQAGKISVPVCRACAPHLRRSRVVDNLLAVWMGIGLFAALMGCFISWQTVILGAVIFLGGLGVFQLRHLRAGASARLGHHRGFDLWVGEGFCGIGTTNGRLVQELLARHGSSAREA